MKGCWICRGKGEIKDLMGYQRLCPIRQCSARQRREREIRARSEHIAELILDNLRRNTKRGA